MPVIDRVKWDGGPKTLAWKYPSDELSTWTQLIVNESQEAFVVAGGVYDGPFLAGRHTLSTENIPLLRQSIGLPFGGRSPFSAEVWYVNRVSYLDIRWGTSEPIQLQDPKFGMMVPVRAFGQYGIRIASSKQFLLKLVGTLNAFDAATVAEYFKGIFTRKIKTEIADLIMRGAVSVLEISRHLDALSTSLQSSLAPAMEEYGVVLEQFSIHSVSMPENDPAVISLKRALAKRAEMGIIGFTYQQERSFEVMQAAASNEGNAGNVLGTALGLGMGTAIGGQLGAGFAQLSTPLIGEVPSVETTPSERIRVLKELVELRDAGALTSEEFEREKRRVLEA